MLNERALPRGGLPDSLALATVATCDGPLDSLALPGLVGDTWYKTDLRITVVRYDASDNRYNVAWSAARGDHARSAATCPLT